MAGKDYIDLRDAMHRGFTILLANLDLLSIEINNEKTNKEEAIKIIAGMRAKINNLQKRM